MDAALLANELIDSRTNKTTPGILCKLDVEKTFDHVIWSFLLKVPSNMGFQEKREKLDILLHLNS